jgi:hypothetical protein
LVHIDAARSREAASEAVIERMGKPMRHRSASPGPFRMRDSGHIVPNHEPPRNLFRHGYCWGKLAATLTEGARVSVTFWRGDVGHDLEATVTGLLRGPEGKLERVVLAGDRPSLPGVILQALRRPERARVVAALGRCPPMAGDSTAASRPSS